MGSSGAPRAGPGRQLRVPRSAAAPRRTSERRVAGRRGAEPGPSIPTKPRSASRSSARRRCALPPSRGGREIAPMGRSPPGRRRGSRPRSAPALPLISPPASRRAHREARPPRRLRAGGRGAANPARVGFSGVEWQRRRSRWRRARCLSRRRISGLLAGSPAQRRTRAAGGRRGGSSSSEPGARAEGEVERSRYAAF